MSALPNMADPATAGSAAGLVNRNMLANFAGGAWAALIGLAFVPIYIRLMGIESYAIVGILVSLQAMFAVLDLGLSQTMSREMARLSAAPGGSAQMGDTARTLEVVYWGASGLVALAVLGLAEFISQQWLNPDQLSRSALREAVWVMALVIGLRWPTALYTGALIGLQRQVLLNSLLAASSTLQAVGAVAVLWYIRPTVQYFLLWQAAAAFVQVALLRAALYRSINSPVPSKFCSDVIRRLWRFAAGMTGIALVSMLLTQVDKILLSKLLSLADFGYYVFAATVASALYALISAVFGGYQPRLAALVAHGESSSLADTYHRGCQAMAVAIIPAGAVLAFFSAELIGLWTGDARMVANTSMLVTLLVIGNVLHGLMHLPYALQLAFGWTRLALTANVIAVLLLLPAIYLSAVRWGAIGAAAVWITMQLGYVCISVRYMHRRLLGGEMRKWYVDDVLKPAAAAVGVAGMGRLLLPEGLPLPWLAAAIAFVSAAALAATVFATGSFSRQRRLPVAFGGSPR